MKVCLCGHSELQHCSVYSSDCAWCACDIFEEALCAAYYGSPTKAHSEGGIVANARLPSGTTLETRPGRIASMSDVYSEKMKSS